MKLSFYWKLAIACLAAIILFKASVNSQALTPRLVGGTGDQSGTGIVQTSDSGFVVVGRQVVNGVNSGLITYFNKTQNVIWAKVLRVGSDAQLIDVEADTSGIYVFGQTTLNGSSHLLLAKMNYQGQIIHQRYISTNSSSLVIPAQLIRLRDGGFAYTSLMGGGAESIIGSTDSLFNPRWLRHFSNGQLNQVRNIVRARDGGILFTGGWIASSGGTSECYYGKLDPQGNTRWLYTLGGPDMEVGLGICEGDSNAIYVSGYEFSDNRDAFVFRTDSLNRIRWTRRYNSDQEYFLNVVMLADGHIACSGDITNDNTGSHLLAIVKFNKTNGSKLWDKQLQGNYNSVTGRGKSLMALPNGLVNIMGSANPPNAFDGYDLIWAMMDLQGSGCFSRSVVGATESDYPFAGTVGGPSISTVSYPQATATIALSDANFCNKDACSGALNTRVLGSDVQICDSVYTIHPEIFPGSNYQWIGGPGTPDYTVHNSGQYIVRVTSACGNFFDTIQVNLSRQQLAVSPSSASICSGDSVRLTAAGSQGSTIAWSGSPNLSDTVGTSTWLTGMNEGTQPIDVVIIVTANGSSGSCPPMNKQIMVRVNSIPSVDAGGDTALCGSISSRLGAASNNPVYEYLWLPTRYLGDAFAVHPIVTNPGIDSVRFVQYKVLATDRATGCQATDSVMIGFNVTGRSNLAGPDLELCSGETASMGTDGVVIPEAYFVWTPSTWLSSANAPKVTITPVLGDTVRLTRRYPYILTYYDYFQSNCPTWIDTVWVTAHPRLELNANGDPVCGEPLFIPNVITPNGDGHNDRFEIRSIDLYPDNALHIYNRWGKKVYSASPYTKPWQPTESGIYFYRLDLKTSNRRYKGWIEVTK